MENFQQFPNLLIDRRNIMSYEEAIKELENIIQILEEKEGDNASETIKINTSTTNL